MSRPPLSSLHCSTRTPDRVYYHPELHGWVKHFPFIIQCHCNYSESWWAGVAAATAVNVNNRTVDWHLASRPKSYCSVSAVRLSIGSLSLPAPYCNVPTLRYSPSVCLTCWPDRSRLCVRPSHACWFCPPTLDAMRTRRLKYQNKLWTNYINLGTGWKVNIYGNLAS